LLPHVEFQRGAGLWSGDGARVERVLHASQLLEQALIQLEPVQEPELVEEVQMVPLKVLIVLIVLIVLAVLVVQEQQPSVIVAPGS